MPKTPLKRVLLRHTPARLLMGVFVVFGLLLPLTSVITLSRPQPAVAASAKTLNFQSRLLTANGGIVPDGTYNVEFKLYNAATSTGSSQGSCTGDAACLWTETRTSGNKVTVKAGYLSVYLGSVTDLPSTIWNQQLWLTMNIGGTGAASWDGEMTPRLQLTAVPAAFSLTNYNSATGFSSSLALSAATGGDQTFTVPDQGAAGAYTLLTQQAANSGYIQNQSAADQTADLRITGTARANTALQAPLLDTATGVALNIGTTNATAINLNQNVTIASGKNLTVTSGTVGITNATTGSALSVTQSANPSAGNALILANNTNGSPTGNLLDLQTGGTSKLSVSVAGDTVVGGNLTVNGTQFTNAGSTVLTASGLSNYTSSGNIGTAAATVDIYTTFTIPQTTAGMTLSLPTPTTSTAGRLAYVVNTGSQPFTMHGVSIVNGKAQTYVFDGSIWTATNIDGAGSGATFVGAVDAQTKSATNGAVISGNGLYLQTADGTNPGLVSTTTQTFAGDKTFTGAATIQGLLTGQLGATLDGGTISLNTTGTANTAIGNATGTLGLTGSAITLTGTTSVAGSNTFTVGTGTTTLGGALGVTGLATLSGGLTATGTTSINATGTANTTIGNASGTLQLISSGLNVSTTGALTGVSGITTSGGYLQSGTSANTFTGVSAFSAAGTALSVTNDANIGGTATIGTLGVTNNATVGGTLGVTSLATLSGGLTVTGATSINTTGTANTNIGNATGTVGVTGSTITFTGATSVAGTNTFTVGTGATSLGGTLGVTGTTTLSGDLAANGNTTIGNATTDRLTVAAQLLGASPLVFQGVTDDGFTTTLAVTDPTANNTITLPNASGTVCLESSATCGFVTGTTASFIQNQNAGAQATSNFWISGTGRADTSLTTPLLDTPTAVALNIGTTNATGINLNQNTSVTGSKTLTVGTGLTTLGGGLTVTGATASAGGTIDLNVSSNFATNINTGTSTGAVSIGNATSGTLTLQGNASSTLVANSGANKTTLSFTTPTGTNSQTFQDNSGVVALGTAGNSLFFTTTGATNVTLPTSGTLAVAPASGSYLKQVPTATADNTITPATTGVVGLTVNGTNTGSAATALAVSQPGAAAGITIASASNTATNGLSFTGTFTGNLINSTNFNVNNAGAVTAVGVNSGSGLLQGTGGITVSGAAASINDNSNFATTINTGTSTGAVTIGNSAAGAIALQSGTSIGLTGITNINASANNATNINTGTSTGAVTIGNSAAGAVGIQSGANITLTSNTSSTGTVVKSATNSSAAFQIQNTAGTAALNVNTITNNIALLASNIGDTGAWASNANQPAAGRQFPSAVYANGYIYIIGGLDATPASSRNVYYAKVNADGTPGAWTLATNILPGARGANGAVYANGRLYSFSGIDGGGNASSTVYYAQIGSDGAPGTWQADTAHPISATRDGATTVVLNGYVYVIAGEGTASALGQVANNAQSTNYYAKISADGTVGAWGNAGSTSQVARRFHSSVAANGYLYQIGGQDSTGAPSTTVQYTQQAANGTVGTWTSTTSLPVALDSATASIANGYVYVMGGRTTGGTIQTAVYYAKINNDGTLGAWQTSGQTLVAGRYALASVVINGNIYTIDGYNGGVQTSIYSAPLAKVQINGDLDLVGMQGGSLAGAGSVSQGSIGGNLTAGNITGVGSLTLQGDANFASSLSVAGNVSIGGTGAATTSFLTPLVDVLSGGTTLSLGTGTATGVTIGGTTNTTAVTLQGAVAATYTIGTATGTGTITLGQSTAGQTINIGAATVATGNTQTIHIGDSATGTGKDVITIGSTNGASQTTVQAGTAGLTLGATAGNIAVTTTTSGTITVTSAGTFALSSTNLNVTTAGVVTLAGGQTRDITTASATTATAIIVQPGDSTTNSGTGSALTLQGSNQTGTTSNGGAVNIKGGTGTTTNGAVNINVGQNAATNINTGANTSAINIGNSTSGTLTLQGGAASTIVANSGANKTTLSFTTPTGTNSQTFQDNSGVVALGTAGNSLFFTTTGATNVTLPTSGTLAVAPASGSYLKQVPTSTADNTVTVGATNAVGLTVTGSTGTANTVVAVNQPSAAAGIVIASTNNTATNGLSFTGTFTNLINGGSAFTVTNAGAITAGSTYNTNTFTGSALQFGSASTATIQSAASQTLNITGHANSTFSTDAGTLTVQGFAGTNVNTPNSAAGATNAVALLTGNATVSGNTGAITLTTGDSTAATAGNITLDVGASSTSNGSILIGTAARAQTITIGNATGGAIRVGQNGSTVQIDGTNFDLSTAGVLTLAGGQTQDITTASAGTSSAVTLQPGDSTTNSGTGSALNLKGSNQTGTTSTGGAVNINGGTGTTTNGATNINASFNGATNINTGTSTGAVSIGNGAAGAITVQSGTSIGLTGATTVNGPAGGSATALTVNTNATTNIGLYVKGVPVQTADLLRIQDGGSTDRVTVTAQGKLSVLVQPTATGSDGALELGSVASQSANDINGVIGFLGSGIQHAQIAYAVGDGFYLCNATSSPSGDYGQCSNRVNLYGNNANFNGGATVSGAAISLNDNSNFATTINTGSSTGNTTIGNGTSTAGIVLLQGNASSAFTATNATGTTKLGFAAPSTAGTVTFELPTGGTGGNTYGICTTLAVCSGYQAAGTYLNASLTDNIADALDIQEGTNNYINVNTTNAAENISFGNATTNPGFNFVGSGTVGVAGALAVTNNTATTTTISSITANGLTTGIGQSIASSSTTLTTGSLLSVSSATTGALATNGIISFQATGNYTSTSNTGLLNVLANSTTAGTVANIQGNALTTGTALNISATSLTTGAALTVVANSSANAIKATGNFQFAQGAARTISVEQQATGGQPGNALTVAAGQGASGQLGGALTLQGGANGTAAGAPGSVIVKANGGNSTTAFQVQNSASTSLLTVDTVNSMITALGDNNGAIGPWTTNTNTLPAVRGYTNSVTANGYVYVIGGRDTTAAAQGTIYYAKLNANGTVGSWSTNSSVPATFKAGVAVANGYLYVIDGNNSAAYYAKLNADGSIGASTSFTLPGNANQTATVAANGYLYAFGGVSSNAVSYARLNADGSVGAWATNANALPPTSLYSSAAVAANGYVYVTGGWTTTTSTAIYSARLNADGSTGTWTTNSGSNPMTTALYYHSTVVGNGYIYIVAGGNSTATAQTAVYYAKLNSDGTVGAWTTNTSNPIPGARFGAGTVMANGYLYVIGGMSNTTTAQLTVYSASAARLQIGGNLDLVGIQGQGLSGNGDFSQGSLGGSITAGNINAIGTLQVSGQTSLAGSLAVAGSASFSDALSIRTLTGSTSAFSVQNASGVYALNIDTTLATTSITGTANFDMLGNFYQTAVTNGDTFAVLNSSNAPLIVADTANMAFINNGVDYMSNQLQNPGFEVGDLVSGANSNWPYTSGTQEIAVDAANARSGNRVYRINGTQAPAAGSVDGATANYFAVRPGQKIYYEGYVKHAVGATGTGGFYVVAYDKDKANAVYSTDTWTDPGTSYTLRSNVYTVPAGKYFLQMSTTVRNPATGMWYFDDLYLRQATEIAPQLFQNSVDSTTAFQVLNSAGTNAVLNVDTTNGRVGINTGAATVPSADLTFGEGATRTINVLTRTTNAAGNGLTISAGAAGAGAAAFSGGTLTLQGGGAGGTGNANGGSVALSGGAGVGTGVQGLVNLSTPQFNTITTDANCSNASANCTILANSIDNYSAIIVKETGNGYTVTMPDPSYGTTSAAGRVIYITAANLSSDFTLSVNGGGTGNTISMKANTTATMIWNGADWTAAGASSSTDLQAAYNNTASSAGAAELVLKNTATSNGLTVRNGTSTDEITGGLLEVQTSIGSNLFSVNNNATEYANNGGSESTTFTMWPTIPTGGSTATITRTTTAGTYATGQAAAQAVTTGATTANQGIANTLASALTSNLVYSVSFTVKGTSNFSTLDVMYSKDGTTTGLTTCATGKTVTQSVFSRIDCSFTAPSSGITSSNAIFIRQSDSNSSAKTYYVDNLSVTINANTNHATDGTADSTANIGGGTNNWAAYDADGGAGTSTVSPDSSIIYDTSSSAKAVTTTGAGQGEGIYNAFSITPSVSTQYLVSFYIYSTTTFNDVKVGFLPAGGSSLPISAQQCTDYNANATNVPATAWTKVTCLVTTPSSGITTPRLVIYQGSSAARTFYIDELTVTLNTNNSSNVQIGGGRNGGPTTLFTLDRSASAPIAANNDAYLGSMYYDTTTGRIQCYESDGWGACGAAPDNIVNLNPEYAGAVLNGAVNSPNNVGTMSADFCSNQTGVLQVNTTLCAAGEARNYYQWTSPQASQQVYSIYVSYQLPATFNGFSDDNTVQLTGRVDDTTKAAVTYEMFKSQGGTLTACGTATTVTTSNNTWQSVGINGNEATGCSFNSSAAGAFIIFKINVKALGNANAYVGTLGFTTTGR